DRHEARDQGVPLLLGEPRLVDRREVGAAEIGLDLASPRELEQRRPDARRLRELVEQLVDPLVSLGCQPGDGASEVFAVVIGGGHAGDHRIRYQPPIQPLSKPSGSVSAGSPGRARRKSKSQPWSAWRTWSR